MSYKYFIFKTIQISMVLTMLTALNLSKDLVLASTKQSESKQTKPEVDYEKFNKYHNLGMAYGLRGELKKALENYNKAIAFNPENAIAYLNRGNIYARQFKWDLTLADYNKAIELDPEISARAYYNRGIIYGRRQQWNKAMSDYTKAIALRSNYYEAYFNYQNVDKVLQQYQQPLSLVGS